jgi:hypothetical protein
VSNAIDACCDVPDPKIPKFEVELLNVDVWFVEFMPNSVVGKENWMFYHDFCFKIWIYISQYHT